MKRTILFSSLLTLVATTQSMDLKVITAETVQEHQEYFNAFLVDAKK